MKNSSDEEITREEEMYQEIQQKKEIVKNGIYGNEVEVIFSFNESLDERKKRRKNGWS